MRRILAALILAFCALAQPAHAQGDSATLSLASSTSIPFTLSGNHIFVRVSVDGKPFAFIFDTGGAASLSPAAAQALALPVIGHARIGGAGNATTDVGIVQVPEFDVGDAKYTNGPFVLLPGLPLISPFKDVTYGGLFGREFFRQLVVTIDYQHSQLIFTQPSAFTAATGSSEVALTMRRDVIPNIQASINGHAGNFDVDAGAGGSLTVTQAFAQQSGLDKEFTKTVTTEIGRGVGGPVFGTLGRGRVFQIGNYQLNNLLVSVVAAGGGGVFARSDLSGNIGGEILRRFTVTLDVPASKAFFLPNEAFATPFVSNHAGLSVFPQGDAWQVESVVPAGPAQQAGVNAGDTIISVNGQSPSALGIDGLRKIWEGLPGSVVQLVYERNGTRYSKSLVLRELV